MSRSPLALVVILALMPATFFAAGSFFGADARPISQIQGSNWKTACQKAGGSMYGCCKSKETECRDGCQSGDSCGNACTQCKNQCSSSYSTCVAKVVKVPPGQKAPSSGTLKAD